MQTHAHVQFHARGLYGKAVDVRLTLRGLATARVAEAAGAKPERRGAFWIRALPAAGSTEEPCTFACLVEPRFVGEEGRG